MSEISKKPPKTLYKYRVWEDDWHKKILTHNEIYLPSADQFNDPFDSSLPIRYKQELTEENIYTKLIEVYQRTEPDAGPESWDKSAKERIASGELTDPAYWKKRNDDLKKSVNEHFGIYCLTPYPDDLLMWAHYSNSHKGFCVGFDTEILHLNAGIGAGIYQVAHSKEFPKWELFGEPVEDMIAHVSTKSTHWTYEQEWRIIKHFGSRKTFNIPTSAIKSIVFGCKINPDSKKEIIEICNTKFKHVKLLDAIIDENEFKLNIA